VCDILLNSIAWKYSIYQQRYIYTLVRQHYTWLIDAQWLELLACWHTCCDCLVNSARLTHCYYRPPTESVTWRITTTSIPTTLSDLQCHSPTASLFKWNCFVQRHTVSLNVLLCGHNSYGRHDKASNVRIDKSCRNYNRRTQTWGSETAVWTVADSFHSVRISPRYHRDQARRQEHLLRRYTTDNLINRAKCGTDLRSIPAYLNFCLPQK